MLGNFLISHLIYWWFGHFFYE